MTAILIILWLAGVLLRVWRLARFFQIEGYDNRRFLRWLTARVERYVVARALIFVGLAFAVTLLIGLMASVFTAFFVSRVIFEMTNFRGDRRPERISI